MSDTHKKSFLIILATIFLLPLFFIPGGSLDLDATKSLLLVSGVILAILTFVWETWQSKKIELPWHPLILIAFLFPLIYGLSAILSTPSSLSLFGYFFEIGTFGYMLIVSLLLILITIVFTDTSKILKTLFAFIISLALITIFTAIQIFFGKSTLNLLGRWTDLATASGLLSVVSMSILGIMPMKKSLRILLYLIFGLSTVLLIILNFSTAFIFTFVASVILLVYFLTVEKHYLHTNTPSSSVRRPGLLPIILVVVSIIFLINPSISEKRGALGDIVANTFGTNNIEVRPSLSATLSISKATLSNSAFLGSGPNTFSRDWLIHKPVDINATPFWGASFPFGVGFIPTQIASTGIAGTLLWLAFFFFIGFLGVKVLSNIPESRSSRFVLVSSFVALLYLWMASFLYAPSAVMLALAFVFTGLFIAVSREVGMISSRTLTLSLNAKTNFISSLLLVIVALGTMATAYTLVNKILSAYYFKKAVNISNTPDIKLENIEPILNKAIGFSPADIHYVALSKIYFVQAGQAASDTKGTPETNLALFQDAISKSITATRQAVSINPAGFGNWIALGTIYSALVPKPLAVSGAYENAQVAYAEARKRNPANPEVSLLLAQLELNKGDAETARSFIREAIALKEDYVDAYLLLAQLEIQANNLPAAIASTEKLVVLVPANPGLYFELGVLKYSNKDYNGAGKAFALALQVTPNYANAQYYLGLSLAQLGRLEDARVQFEALIVTNPDSPEVKAILKSLRAGKSPF